jgi:hypothetical protein
MSNSSTSWLASLTGASEEIFSSRREGNKESMP